MVEVITERHGVIFAPEYITILPAPLDWTAARPAPFVRLAMFQQDLSVEITQALSSLVLTEQFRTINSRICKPLCEGLTGNVESLPVLEQHLEFMCNGASIIAPHLFNSQVVPYLQTFSEIETVDVLVRFESFGRFCSGHFHTDGRRYQDHPVSIQTVWGGGTRCVLLEQNDPDDIANGGLYLPCPDTPPVISIPTGHVGWLFGGDRSIFHAAAPFSANERRMVSVVVPSNASLRKLGIFAPG